jgi:hypothetical protein
VLATSWLPILTQETRLQNTLDDVACTIHRFLAAGVTAAGDLPPMPPPSLNFADDGEGGESGGAAAAGAPSGKAAAKVAEAQRNLSKAEAKCEADRSRLKEALANFCKCRAEYLEDDSPSPSAVVGVVEPVLNLC